MFTRLFFSFTLGGFLGISLNLVHPPAALADALEDLLQEVKIPTLPARTREALDYLMQQKGFHELAAHEVIERLQSQQNMHFTLIAGPTHEAILYPLNSLDSLFEVETLVKAQHERDQYRPDYDVAQQLFQNRIPPLQQQLQAQEREATEKASLCVQTFKTLQAEQKSVQNNLSEVQSYLQGLQTEQAQLMPHYQTAQNHFNEIAQKYRFHQHKYTELNAQWEQKMRQRTQLEQRIQQAWALAQQEEQLIWKDAANAKTHRERAAAHRKTAAYLQQELKNLDVHLSQLQNQKAGETNQINSLRPYYEAAETRLVQEKQRYDKVLEKIQSTQKAQQSLAERSQAIAEKVKANQAEQAHWLHIIPLLRHSQNLLAEQLSGLQKASDYSAYLSQYKSQHLEAMQKLHIIFQDASYTQHFGATLAQQLAPLQHLTQAMQKPELK